MISNPDCAFYHAIDDTALVQGWLDNEDGKIWGHELHIGSQITFKHAHSQFNTCTIYIAQELISSKPWYVSLVVADVHRFVNCTIAFGKDVYHYDTTGRVSFVQKLP
jgi:hypothetical protein